LTREFSSGIHDISTLPLHICLRLETFKPPGISDLRLRHRALMKGARLHNNHDRDDFPCLFRVVCFLIVCLLFRCLCRSLHSFICFISLQFLTHFPQKKERKFATEGTGLGGHVTDGSSRGGRKWRRCTFNIRLDGKD
jgi:hypothetical protein